MPAQARLETTTDAPTHIRVHRVEVWGRDGQADPVAESAHRHLRAISDQAGAAIGRVRSGRVYLIEGAIEPAHIKRIAGELLTDPITQQAVIGVAPRPDRGAVVEVHYKLGVMDPVAQSTRNAARRMLNLGDCESSGISVRTGLRYDFYPANNQSLDECEVRAWVTTALANPVIQEVHGQPYRPDRFAAGSAYELKLTHVPIRDLDDDALAQLSRGAHLFLSLEEMTAIRDYYRQAGREPTDIELETLAQTWSEHCVHKTLKATIRYRQGDGRTPGPTDWLDRPGHHIEPDGSLTIRNLLKSTIAAATGKLMAEEPDHAGCVSVFDDNSGIVRFDDDDAVCIKVETHNHPSAIEPYGGAATGIGGCIRDIMGTGQVAKPIANTNVFCVGHPERGGDGTADADPLPNGVIPPRRTLEQVVAGVRDYGNRMGIPTVNGAVWFHDNYIANPLVFAGCAGLIPLDRCFGEPQNGDRIIALGGRTGRDGIHGATFSSAELTDTHADEFSHAVQIGNAITQKKTLDVLLQARDHADGCLFTAVTDCGAGGFSSAVGEMGEKRGASVTLETAPLKYQGLTYTETWISEAQERMVLAVPVGNVDRLRALCAAEDVEFCDLGQFGSADASGEPQLVLTYRGTEVGRLSMGFLHDGVPMPVRDAEWATTASPTTGAPKASPKAPPIAKSLYKLLAHPNIASKHWIIRQYDHEVQGGSVVKPLVGPEQAGPSDAAVVRPKLGSAKGIALACGLQTGLGEPPAGTDRAGPDGDSYWMTLAAIDEAVRNCVCVGADPERVYLLDNFCWPNCDDPQQLGSLVRAAEACYDGAMAYRAPFVSGKDSLSNQFTTEDGRLITIPPTMLISALAIVQDVTRCVTMDAKAPGNRLLVVGPRATDLGGSHYAMVHPAVGSDHGLPRVDLAISPRVARVVASMIADRLIASAHDCSDGGLLVAAAEMAFAGGIGLDLDLRRFNADAAVATPVACFAEGPSRYLLEVLPSTFDRVTRVLEQAGLPFAEIGTFTDHDRLILRDADSPDEIVSEPIEALEDTWRRPLDW